MKFEVVNGTFSYGSKQVLKDICVDICSGEVMSILGPNGVGKTTLLKCMMGLLEWSSGESRLDGKNIKGIKYREFWQRVAYVPQAKVLTFGFSALDMVVLGLGTRIGPFGQPKPQDFEHAQRCLDAIGVGHLAHKLCTQMSGGELQMVLIARALISDPELLVLDEPESGLDFKNQLIVLETITNLARERGIATVVNTHYPEHALKVSDKALMLFYDRPPVFGHVDHIVCPEHMRSAFNVNVHMGDFSIEEGDFKFIVPVSVI